MEALKLHSDGQKDHLKSLKEKYIALKNRLKQHQKLTEEEKQTEFKKIKEQYHKENRDAQQNLY